ncbi:MAG: Na(+)-translocating NADH-quinone reductase subunit F [Flavobacteriales bacterium]|nr:MAG: Na(+)-translocating NADH-quinone reductase subunit F [Flavobacteriales bacterium]
MTPLTQQELHNLAMNIVGERLKKMGYEFLALNSQLKKHPQFVLHYTKESVIFVLVKVTNNVQEVQDYHEAYEAAFLEKFLKHAAAQKAKVWFASVGLANAENIDMPVFKGQPYYVAFEDFVKIIP